MILRYVLYSGKASYVLFLLQHLYFKDAMNYHIIMYITIMNIVILSISNHLIPCSLLMSLSVNNTLVLMFYCATCLY